MNTAAALANGALEGALLTAIVWLALRAVPRRALNAATRYALWWATLAVVLTLPALHMPLPRWSRGTSVSADAAPWLAPSVGMGLQPAKSHEESWGRRFRVSAPDPGPSGWQAKAPAPPTVPPPMMPAAARWTPIEIEGGAWQRWVLAIWALAAGLLLVRLAVSYVLLARRSARAIDAPASLRTQAKKWLALCGATRGGIRVAASAEISVPVAVGPLRPSILIPARLLAELDDADLNQIGLHETAHLARRDDYALMLQRVLEALFALHPVVRWIARRIDLEREMACDDLVVRATGHPRAYASCLTRIVELRGGVEAFLAGATAAGDASHLARRVDMLLDKTRNSATHLLKVRLTVVIALLAVLVWLAGRAPGLVAFATPLVQDVLAADPAPPAAAPAMDAAPQAGEPAPDFEGRVVEDSSNSPLASAELRVHRAGLRELAADLDTDREGRFRAPGLPPGEYTIDVSKPNYVTANFRIRIPAAVNVRLVRYGAIAGQAVDGQGQPLQGRVLEPGGRTAGSARIVVLVRPPGGEGLREFRQTPLEEGGRFRIYDLPPGEYAIGLWYAGLSAGSGMQLYPDTAHPRFFTIAGGEEYRDINFSVFSGSAYQVSGKVVLPKTGDSFQLALGLPEQPALPIAQTLTERDGSFRFDKIPSGSYDLFAAGPTRGYTAFESTLVPEPLFARMRVQVAAQNIDGLTIAVAPARSLSLVLRAQGSGTRAEGCPESASVTLTALEPWGSLLFATAQVTFGKEQTVRNLAPGRYRVTAAGLGAACYQVNAPVADLSGDAVGTLAVEVAAAGSIRGQLRAGAAKAADFAVVLLDAASTDGAQVQIAYPDSSGRFTFDALRPGRYRIGARGAAEASRARWVADFDQMTEIDVPGGAHTDLELPVPVQKGDR